MAALVPAMLLSVQSPAAAQSATPPSKPGIFENLSLFVGPDGSKQPQDLGINAEMGVRFAANWGFPILERFNLGAQVGAASNISDGAVDVLNQIGGPGHRTQTFVTMGVFQRPTSRVNWGVVYDTSFERYYDNFHFAQWRGQAGYGVTASDEVGMWFAKSAEGQDGHMGVTAVRLDPISQVNAYTRHTWASHAQTTVWVGVANAHSNVVWVLPDNSSTGHVLVYGSSLDIPLSAKICGDGSGEFHHAVGNRHGGCLSGAHLLSRARWLPGRPEYVCAAHDRREQSYDGDRSAALAGCSSRASTIG